MLRMLRITLLALTVATSLLLPACDVIATDPAASAFAFLDGEFDVVVQIPSRDGTVKENRARAIAWRVAETGVSAEAFDHLADEERAFASFRVRRFDMADRSWHAHHYDTVEKRLQKFVGGPAGAGTIVLTSEGPQPGRIDRITWSEVSASGARWTYELSGDGGQSFRKHATARYERAEMPAGQS